MTEEILEVVDEQNQVVSTAPRSHIHKQHLMHRAVHIFVFNAKGELFLQKRAKTKDEFPSCYDSSAAGHLRPGEDYHAGALRELAEELGISASLQEVVALPASAETGWEFAKLYTAISDEIVQPNADEIEEAGYYSIAEIRAWLTHDGNKFTPSFKKLFALYQGLQGNFEIKI
jgi:16S rRNA (adenine1518-N6/adenine1519-N6)-dimethyltransferase